MSADILVLSRFIWYCPLLTAVIRGGLMTNRVGRWVLVGAAAVIAGGAPGLAALRAAGLNGTAPAGAGAFKQLVSTLTSNWEWLIGTGVGLVLVLIAGLM